MAGENKQAISLDQLSHFKAKQDLQNEQKFKRKDDSTDLKGAVRYDAAQALTEQEKAQARLNIGAAAPGEGAVRYDVEQALSDDDKTRARENIGTTDGTWESMPDKPFGETGGWSIEWDGTPTSDFVDIFEGVRFYKVSDKIPSKEDLVGAKYVGVDGELQLLELILSSSDIDNYSEACYGLADEPYFLITTQPTEFSIGDLIFPFLSSGTWFMGLGGRVSLSNNEIKKIDKKFLPDDIKVELPEGLVTTDENGLIPAALLPSYVDDVVEGYYNGYEFYKEYNPDGGMYLYLINGESGKIYVDIDTGNTYRWSGSQYVQLNPPKITFATDADIDALFT